MGEWICREELQASKIYFDGKTALFAIFFNCAIISNKKRNKKTIQGIQRTKIFEINVARCDVDVLCFVLFCVFPFSFCCSFRLYLV